jgi:hypothetical protein
VRLQVIFIQPRGVGRVLELLGVTLYGGSSACPTQNREIDRKVPMIAGQGPSLSLSQACGQLSLASEGDSEGDVVCIGAPLFSRLTL